MFMIAPDVPPLLEYHHTLRGWLVFKTGNSRNNHVPIRLNLIVAFAAIVETNLVWTTMRLLVILFDNPTCDRINCRTPALLNF